LPSPRPPVRLIAERDGESESLPGIRIVLVELRGIERDIVLLALRDRDDMTVVTQVRNRSTLRRVVQSARPDLLIWHLDAAEVPDACPDLLFEHPELKVLVLDREGIGFVWSLRPVKDHLGELSPSCLVKSIETLFTTRAPGRFAEST
jgi:hypothetical protein